MALANTIEIESTKKKDTDLIHGAFEMNILLQSASHDIVANARAVLPNTAYLPKTKVRIDVKTVVTVTVLEQ